MFHGIAFPLYVHVNVALWPYDGALCTHSVPASAQRIPVLNSADTAATSLPKPKNKTIKTHITDISPRLHGRHALVRFRGDLVLARRSHSLARQASGLDSEMLPG